MNWFGSVHILVELIICGAATAGGASPSPTNAFLTDKAHFVGGHIGLRLWLPARRAHSPDASRCKKGVTFVRSLRYSLFCAEAAYERSELRPHLSGLREVPH